MNAAEADPPGLRLTAVGEWLRRSGVPFGTDGRPSAVLLPAGRSNLTYRISDGTGRDLIVRRAPLGHLMPSAHDMQREFRVLTGLFSIGFPVPEPIALCDDESITGTAFQVMEFVEGRVIADARAASDLGPAQASASSAALVDTLADLHRVDAAGAGLHDLGRPAGYLPRQVRRWADQWTRTSLRELADLAALGDWLESRVDRLPSDLPWAIVHGDYRVDNVILDPTEPRIRAVVDWEMATLGDPVLDLATFLVYWSQSDDGERASLPVAQHITTGPGFPDRRTLIERYARGSGLPLDHLDFCAALACYKLAVIMESIAFRARAGQQLGTGGAENMSAATEVLARIGLAVTRLGVEAGLRY